MILLLAACAVPKPSSEVHFVRDGIVKEGAFEARAWTPGETVDGVVAPVEPECAPLFSVALEDATRLAASGAPAPGTTLAFSPDARWLAVGSDLGSLRIVDATTGVERVSQRLAEGAVKQVAWSADGGTLYVGEQSPDALLSAVEPATLERRWSVRLADELETSALPPADDVYGLYSLPSVFAIRVLDGGDLLVAGAHGWVGADGVRRNRSRLYRFSPDGVRRGAWPEEPANAVLLHPVVTGDRALVGVGFSADGPPPTDIPANGVAAIDLSTMTLAWGRSFEPLLPWFKDVYLWEAAGLSGVLAMAGMGDGRVFLLEPSTGELRTTLSPGVPVLSQGVPISAGVGFGAVVGDEAYFLTTSTNIPWGSADPMTRPPSAHPAQDTVHAVRHDGTERWTWHGDYAIEGLTVSPDGRSLLVAAADREADTRTDLFGALILDRASGKLVTTCPTEGPAYFRPAWAQDGRIAVSEAPFSVDGAVRGAYRVTVFR